MRGRCHQQIKTMIFSNLIFHCCKCEKIKQIWKPLLIGQVLSILVSASGAANDTLHFDCNLSAPTLQAGLIYFLLSFSCIGLLRNRSRRGGTIIVGGGDHRGVSGIEIDVTGVATYYKNTESHNRCWNLAYSLKRFCGSFYSSLSIQGSPKIYFIMALLDLEANYFTFLAFRYTSLTSVSLLDAFAIPSAMMFSRLLLKRSYKLGHFLGAAICTIGIIVNVFIDYEEVAPESYYDLEEDDANQAQIENIYPYQIRGDLLAIIGSILYGLNNVLTERAVRHIGGVTEYLGMLGVFGSLIALVQGLILDRAAIMEFFTLDEDECSASKGFLILFASTTFGLMTYIGVSNFLVKSEATLLNLSFLTGDLWSAAFVIVVQKIIPSPMFWVALILIVIGVFVYELSESPIVDEREPVLDNNISDGRMSQNGLIQQQNEGEIELDMSDEII